VKLFVILPLLGRLTLVHSVYRALNILRQVQDKPLRHSAGVELVFIPDFHLRVSTNC